VEAGIGEEKALEIVGNDVELKRVLLGCVNLRALGHLLAYKGGEGFAVVAEGFAVFGGEVGEMELAEGVPLRYVLSDAVEISFEAGFDKGLLHDALQADGAFGQPGELVGGDGRAGLGEFLIGYLCGLVEEGSENVGWQEVGGLFDFRQVGYMLEEELQGAVDIGGEGGGRKAQLTGHERLCVVGIYRNGGILSEGGTGLKAPTVDGEIGAGCGLEEKKLLHEAGHFAFFQPVGSFVIDQCDLTGTGEKPEEVVGEHGCFLSRHGEIEGQPHIVGNERVVGIETGQYAFGNGEHEQVVEVEAACFQNTHDLQTGGRLAVEGYRLVAHDLAQ